MRDNNIFKCPLCGCRQYYTHQYSLECVNCGYYILKDGRYDSQPYNSGNRPFDFQWVTNSRDYGY